MIKGKILENVSINTIGSLHQIIANQMASFNHIHMDMVGPSKLVNMGQIVKVA